MGVRLNIPHADFSENGMAVSSNVPIGPVVVSIAVTGASNATNGTEYTAIATLGDGTTSDITNMVTWSISNNECSIANGVVTTPEFISESGVVISASYTDPDTGVKTGTKTIGVTGYLTQYDFIKTTEDDQYIKLIDTGLDVDGIAFGEFDVEVKGYTPSQIPSEDTYTESYISMRYTGVNLYKGFANSAAAINILFCSAQSVLNFIGGNTDTEFITRVDVANSTSSIKIGNNQPVTGELNSLASQLTPKRQPVIALAFYNSDNNTITSTAGRVRVKEIILYERGTSTKLLDFIPVKDSNNVACLFEKVNKKYYYENSGGTLEVGFIQN